MDKILEAITAEMEGVGPGTEKEWNDWRGRRSITRRDSRVWITATPHAFLSVSDACKNFAYNWRALGDVAYQHEQTLDAVLNAVMQGPLTWRDWRGTLTLMIINGEARLRRNAESIHSGPLVAAARRFIEEWEVMGEPTPEPAQPEPVTEMDILRGCAAALSLKLLAVSTELLALHEIIAGLSDGR